LSESADSLKTLRCGAILNPPRFFYMLRKIAFCLLEQLQVGGLVKSVTPAITLIGNSRR